jgi:hypothetical protein
MGRYLLLAVFTFGAAVGAEAQTEWAEQTGHTCDLKKFGDRWDGWTNGTKVWFGRVKYLRCAYFVLSDPMDGFDNVISAGGMFDSANSGMYHTYSVAFFDSAGDLIACGTNAQDFWLVLVKAISVTCDLPIPDGVEKLITRYQVAYAESDQPFAKIKRMEPGTKPTENGDHSQIVRPVCRPLSLVSQERVRAVTMNGPCRLKEEDCLDEGVFSAQIGDELLVKAECRFVISRDSAIETWYSFRNMSEKKVFTVVYCAFFDKDGNLIGGTHLSAAIAAREAYPTATISTPGTSPQITASFTSAPNIVIPVDWVPNVAAYRITMYASDIPFGRVRETSQQETND